ncbi:MAG: tetratricopeptide repeat protein [Alphaproteobacteria bacterium]
MAARIEELIARGVALRKAGDRDGAIALYRQAAAAPRAPAAAHFNLGNALLDAGDLAEADRHLAAALRRDPKMIEAAIQRARCAVRGNRPADARARFAEALRIDPPNFTANLELGHLLRQAGELEPAVEHYRRAATAAPTRWEAGLALARALEDAGRHDEAARHYHRALPMAREGGSARAIHWRMAKYRLERGDAPRALEAMRQALLSLRAEQPGPDANERAEMQIDLGDMLLRLGMDEEADRAFERASAATAEATLARLAECAFRHNRWREAQAVLRRSVELHPDSPSAHWNLAHISTESWQLQQALDALARAEALAPQAGARSMRASIAGRMGDADGALRLYRELAEAEGVGSTMASSAAMSALYSGTLDAQAVADLHRRLFAGLGEGARDRARFRNDRDPARRIRLGMVSADFHRQHPVNIFMQPVLARLDRAAFETTVYFTGIARDEQTRIARGRVDRWRDCATWPDETLARRIEDDRIDVLLDLSGHTARHRMRMFARRAAPAQVTYLGYPASTGVPNMDWLIADPVVAPAELSHLYSERVLRLPHTVFCYAPEADYPFPDFDTAHPVTFGSFNNVPKLTPRTIRLWSAILARVPGSRLLLKAPSFTDAGAADFFRQRFAAEGIGPDRLELRGPTGLADMMAEYGDVDIALDPVPYNGGTTTMQALWMGAPVVAMAGTLFASRMGASFMTAAGLPEWVAADDDAYVETAARMAADRGALLALKRGLRDRLQASPAWDIDRFVRDFEGALRTIWADCCAR